MSYYFAIIGPKDTPIYTLEFGTYRQGNDGQSKFPAEMKELNPFVLHSALDIVEDVQWSTPTLYLKAVDNFYAYMISAFVTAGNIKFLLLHESRNEEPIRQFFTDVYDLYVKALLSPFYFVNQPITSPVFDQKVRALAKKYLWEKEWIFPFSFFFFFYWWLLFMFVFPFTKVTKPPPVKTNQFGRNLI